jgi:F-type H+-transporting ATPase subunit gamma
METAEDLKRRIGSANDLHGVVKTMKTLAAVSIRQYEESLRSVDEYYRSVELGLKALLLSRPARHQTNLPPETIVFIIGSDQGMVGQFNESVASFAKEDISGEGQPPKKPALWAAGARAAASGSDRFGEVAEFFPLPSSPRSTGETVQDVMLRLEEQRRSGGEVQFLLYYNYPSPALGWKTEKRLLLPPDSRWLERIRGTRWPRRGLPLYTLDWEDLFGSLVGEYLFVSLFRAFSSSMAAENAARLASMQRAEKNIEEMRENFVAAYNAARQAAVTEELFDVISGFEALTSEKSSRI